MKRTRIAKIEPRVKEQVKYAKDEPAPTEPTEKELLRATYKNIVARLSEYIEPQRLEEFEVWDASYKLAKRYDVCDDELVITLIGQKSEMRLIMDWKQARELARELTGAILESPDTPYEPLPVRDPKKKKKRERREYVGWDTEAEKVGEQKASEKYRPGDIVPIVDDTGVQIWFKVMEDGSLENMPWGWKPPEEEQNKT